jgi:hypothetical protein
MNLDERSFGREISCDFVDRFLIVISYSAEGVLIS